MARIAQGEAAVPISIGGGGGAGQPPQYVERRPTDQPRLPGAGMGVNGMGSLLN